MSERKAVGTTATASGAMDAKGGGNKVVERSRLAAKGDAVERVKDKDRNAAGGAGKSPKKRRKVNHGTQHLAFPHPPLFEFPVIVMFPGELDKEGQLDATVGSLPLSLLLLHTPSVRPISCGWRPGRRRDRARVYVYCNMG